MPHGLAAQKSAGNHQEVGIDLAYESIERRAVFPTEVLKKPVYVCTWHLRVASGAAFL
jgi:hypothetical protein